MAGKSSSKNSTASTRAKPGDGANEAPPAARLEGVDSLRHTEPFAATVLNSLSAHIAILDENGVILETNRAWREFAVSNAVDSPPDMLGVNYLELCDCAGGDSAEGAGEVSRGIRRVIAGELDEFLMDYPCHSPDRRRWFYMRARRVSGPGPLRVVVSHENITALKLAEEALRRREEELERKTLRLDETNAALKVLLQRREADRRELEEQVLANVRELAMPYVEKLRGTPLDADQRAFLEILEGHLDEVVSPFLHRLYADYRNLTPQEIRVASLVKEGRSTKEIGELLHVSPGAVEFHRKNIRRKFGLQGRRANLRTFLLSLG
ncbi:MAG: LuxR C-terminal-related transcriptional regulator [Thermodesulfobacteriota bacterium]